MSVTMGLIFPLTFMALFLAFPATNMAGKQVSGVQFGLTAVSLMALLSLAFSATATPITQMRENEVLRSFQLLGVTKAQFIASVLPSRIAVAVAQMLLVFVFGLVVGSPLEVNWPMLVIAGALAIVLTQSLALFIGGLSHRTSVVAGITGAVIPVLLMISGVLLPPSLLPEVVRESFSFNPLAQIGDLMRHSTLGTSLQFPLWRTVATSLGFSVALFVGTAVTFKWQEPER